MGWCLSFLGLRKPGCMPWGGGSSRNLLSHSPQRGKARTGRQQGWTLLSAVGQSLFQASLTASGVCWGCLEFPSV